MNAFSMGGNSMVLSKHTRIQVSIYCDFIPPMVTVILMYFIPCSFVKRLFPPRPHYQQKCIIDSIPLKETKPHLT